jgi:hypothetical protein
VVAGHAALDGTLAFDLGFMPDLDDAFSIISYGSRSGEFSAITGYQIETDRSFSVHYNGDRAMAIAGQWLASGEELAGVIDTPADDLLVSGDWMWSGLVVKQGAGELVLDLSGLITAGPDAMLAILAGDVRLQGDFGDTLRLEAIAFGDLSGLSPSLAGESGWLFEVSIPEPTGAALLTVGLMGMLRRRR